MVLRELAEVENGHSAVTPLSQKTRVSHLAAFEHFERMVGSRAVRNISKDDLLIFHKTSEGQKGRDGRKMQRQPQYRRC